jgi:hypothetical protein
VAHEVGQRMGKARVGLKLELRHAV